MRSFLEASPPSAFLWVNNGLTGEAEDRDLKSLVAANPGAPQCRNPPPSQASSASCMPGLGPPLPSGPGGKSRTGKGRLSAPGRLGSIDSGYLGIFVPNTVLSTLHIFIPTGPMR